MLDTLTTEGSTLVTMKPNCTLPNNNYGRSEVSGSLVNKDGLWRVYYKKPRHTKETCWKFHRKPQSFGRGNESQYAQSRQWNSQAYIAQSKENSQLEISTSSIQMDCGVMLDTPTTKGSALVTMKPKSILPNNNYGGVKCLEH